MRTAIVATAGTAAVLVAASMLGIASAETSTTPPVRSVSVEGVGGAPIDQEANSAAADAAYRLGMAAAIADAQAKAEFLAAHAGGTIGAVQGIVEDGGGLECTSPGEPNSYANYLGAQPDFGNSSVRTVGVVAPEAASKATGAPTVNVKGHKKKKTKAKKSSAASCTVTAQVSIVYLLN
jgi:hypothetical protein